MRLKRNPLVRKGRSSDTLNLIRLIFPDLVSCTSSRNWHQPNLYCRTPFNIIKRLINGMEGHLLNVWTRVTTHWTKSLPCTHLYCIWYGLVFEILGNVLSGYGDKRETLFLTYRNNFPDDEEMTGVVLLRCTQSVSVDYRPNIVLTLFFFILFEETITLRDIKPWTNSDVVLDRFRLLMSYTYVKSVTLSCLRSCTSQRWTVYRVNETWLTTLQPFDSYIGPVLPTWVPLGT